VASLVATGFAGPLILETYEGDDPLAAIGRARDYLLDGLIGGG
jgi:hypothetical protein